MTITMGRPLPLAPNDTDHCLLAWCANGGGPHTDHLGTDESARFAGDGYGAPEDGYLATLMGCLEQRGHGPVLLNMLASDDHLYWNGYLSPAQAEEFARRLLLLVALAHGVSVDSSYTVAGEAIARFRLVAAAVAS